MNITRPANPLSSAFAKRLSSAAPNAPACAGREGWRSEAFAEDFLGPHGDFGDAFFSNRRRPATAGKQRRWQALLQCAVPLTVALAAGVAACLQALA